MKRRFRSEADLAKAASRRGFVVSGALQSEPAIPVTETPAEPREEPKPAPASTLDPVLLQLLGSNVAATTALTSRLEERFAKEAEEDAAEEDDTEEDKPPRRWRVRVTARDYEGRISEVQIEPQEDA